MTTADIAAIGMERVERRNGMDMRPGGVPVCASCRWYVKNSLGLNARYDECTSPQNVTASDIIRGDERARIWQYCEGARRHDCGPDGKWFEPRLPIAANTAELHDGLAIEPEDDTARLARVVEELKR